MTVSVLSLVAVVSRAYAERQAVDVENPPLTVVEDLSPPLPAAALRVDVGIGSPVGVLGVVYTRPLAPQLGVEIGAGLGASGLQLSIMGKYRGGDGGWRFTPGLGLSLGVPLGEPTFHSGHPDGDEERRGRGVWMPWLDVDLLGVEYRAPGGLLVAASAGVTVALAHAHYDIAELGSDISPGTPAPQLRLGVGASF